MKPTFFATLAAVSLAVPSNAVEDCGCNRTPPEPGAAIRATPLVLAPDAAPGPAAEPAEKVLLRLKLRAGQKYVQKMAMDQRTATVVDKSKINMSFKFNTDMALDVVAVTPNGEYDVRYTFGDMKITMGELPVMPGMDAKTRRKASADMKAGIDRMAGAFRGRVIGARISPEGKTLSVTGVAGLFEALAKASPGGNAAQRAQDKAMMEGMVKSLSDKDNGILKMSGQLPPQAVGAGDSWNATQKVDQAMFSLKMDTRYTLTSRKDGISNVDILVRISQAPPQKVADSRAPLPRITLSGAGKGVMEIDEATGMATRLDMTTTTTSKVMIPGGGKNGVPASVTTYANARVTMDTVAVGQ